MRDRHPGPDHVYRRGKYRGFTKSERDPRTDERGEGCQRGRWCERSEQRPPEHCRPEHDLPTITIRECSTRGHEREIADKKRRKYPALGRLGPPELRLHGDRGDGDVRTIEVRDEHRGTTEQHHRVPERPAPRGN